MATPNIKNFSTSFYVRLRGRAERNHRSIAQEVTHILESALAETDELSILELEGLGEELWEALDVTDHVESERRSWG